MRPAIRAAVLTRAPAALLAALLAALPAAAEGQDREPRPSPPVVRAGAGLSLATFATRQQRRLLARDTDGDGTISRAEFLGGAGRAKVDPARRFVGLDRNGDGAVDRAEIDAMAARRFARLDTDGDGVLSAGERSVARTRVGTADPAG